MMVLPAVQIEIGRQEASGRGGSLGEVEYSLPRRVVSSARGKALAQEYDIAYFETPAKENIDVDELFLPPPENASGKHMGRHLEIEIRIS